MSNSSTREGKGRNISGLLDVTIAGKKREGNVRQEQSLSFSVLGKHMPTHVHTYTLQNQEQNNFFKRQLSKPYTVNFLLNLLTFF